MNALPPLRLAAAGMHLVAALVWATISLELARLWQAKLDRSRLYLLLLLISGSFAVHLLLHVVIELTPGAPGAEPVSLHAALDAAIGVLTIAMGPMSLHAVALMPAHEPRPSRRRLAVVYGSAVALMPAHEPRPSRRWLAVVYGSAVAVLAAGALGAALPALLSRLDAAPFGAIGSRGVHTLLNQLAIPYVIVMMTLALARSVRSANRGRWRQGAAIAELRSPDLAVLGVTLALGGAMLLWLVTTGAASLASIGPLFLHTAVALGFAVPFAVRMLGRVVHGLLVSATLLLASIAAYLGFPALAARSADPTTATLTILAGLVVLIAILVPGRALVRDVADRLLFHRGRVRQAELLDIVNQLSPELGIAACCRGALEHVTRVMQFQSAAIVLTHGRGSFAHGPFDLAALERRWPTDLALTPTPARPIMEVMLDQLPEPMSEALVAANVSRLAPIVGPRQQWGFLFASEGLFAAPFNEADIEALAAFLGQLALLLDGAELRDRAIAVERSLAHAEKLAAIGELTARIAHEIRNPVTAARSLAQQLAREGGTAREEHALILAALDRVERHMAELLRFARRDELRPSETELGELVRSTVADLRSRLEQASVRVTVDAPDAVVGVVDREKVRQVLVNLLENARDALVDWHGERALAIDVANSNGRVTLRVRDSGPGVEPELLDRLFEPFFTSKKDGTGLGLAIVKRIVDAHGGVVRAELPPGGGLCFEIDLPVGTNA
ncbi:MAG: ATP-binding protein [Thermodesulfobacteriota bacterium]